MLSTRPLFEMQEEEVVSICMVGTVRWVVKKFPIKIVIILHGFGSGVKTRVVVEEDYAK